MKLLVIDDDLDTLDVMRMTLTHRGFTVVCAEAAADALDHVEREEFDAVLSDLDLPLISGVELCRRIRSRRPNLPVVLVTGLRGAPVTEAALRAGAHGVVSKPVQIQELLATLARAVEQQQHDVGNQAVVEKGDLHGDASGRGSKRHA